MLAKSTPKHIECTKPERPPCKLVGPLGRLSLFGHKLKNCCIYRLEMGKLKRVGRTTVIGLGRRVSVATCVACVVLSNLLVLQLHQLRLSSARATNDDCGNTLGASTASYNLAYEQSFGFFDDISDSDWKTHYQQAALTAPHYRYDDDRDKAKTAAEWIFFNWDPYFNCPRKRKIGGLGGGPKWVCDIDRLKRVAAQRQKQQGANESPCLVYSIGSKKNYKFEDGLFEIIGPMCEIHIFDPGPYDRQGMEERNMHFHQWGLGSSYSAEWMKKKERKGTFLSFQEIRKRLGHENRTIDLFKIDCEGCEWHSYRDWIGADLRQILIETHDLPDANAEKKTEFGIFPALSPSSFFDSLYHHGFVLFSKEVNTHRGLGRASEWSFLKLHSSFFHPK